MSTFVFPYQFVLTPKVLMMLYEGEFPRQVYMDGRRHLTECGNRLYGAPGSIGGPTYESVANDL